MFCCIYWWSLQWVVRWFGVRVIVRCWFMCVLVTVHSFYMKLIKLYTCGIAEGQSWEVQTWLTYEQYWEKPHSFSSFKVIAHCCVYTCFPCQLFWKNNGLIKNMDFQSSTVVDRCVGKFLWKGLYDLSIHSIFHFVGQLDETNNRPYNGPWFLLCCHQYLLHLQLQTDCSLNWLTLLHMLQMWMNVPPSPVSIHPHVLTWWIPTNACVILDTQGCIVK